MRICLQILLILLLSASPAFAQISSKTLELSTRLGIFTGIDAAKSKEQLDWAVTTTYRSPYYEEQFTTVYKIDVGYELDTGMIGGFRAGYNLTPYIGFELNWGWSNANAELFGIVNDKKIKIELESSQFLFETNIVFHILPSSRIIPFVTTGIGLVYIKGKTIESIYKSAGISRTRCVFNIGGGIKTFLNDKIGLRLDVRFYNAGLGFEEFDPIAALEISIGLFHLFKF